VRSASYEVLRALRFGQVSGWCSQRNPDLGECGIERHGGEPRIVGERGQGERPLSQLNATNKAGWAGARAQRMI
jgi:hypothetical protein